MSDVSKIVYDDVLTQEIAAEIAKLYTGPRDFTLAEIQELGLWLQDVGAGMSGPDSTSRQQLMGAAFQWFGSALETGTFGPVPDAFYDFDTVARNYGDSALN